MHCHVKVMQTKSMANQDNDITIIELKLAMASIFTRHF